jgi:hypothetical protein
MRKKSRKRMVGSNPAWCYLCGLPIPDDIASPRHPLFGTVDHIIPLSRNGPDAVRNRAPAHRLCNAQKGNHMIHPEEFATELRARVLPLFASLGREVSQRAQRAAIRRSLQAWPAWAPICRREAGHVAIQRWEDDGGSISADDLEHGIGSVWDHVRDVG